MYADWSSLTHQLQVDNSEPESSEDSELYEKLAGEGCLDKKDFFFVFVVVLFEDCFF